MTEPKTNFIANDLDLAVKRDFLIRDRGYSPDMLINPDDVAKLKAKEDIKINNQQLVENERNAMYAQQSTDKMIELGQEANDTQKEAYFRSNYINSDDLIRATIGGIAGFGYGGVVGAVGGFSNELISKSLGFNIPTEAIIGIALRQNETVKRKEMMKLQKEAEDAKKEAFVNILTKASGIQDEKDAAELRLSKDSEADLWEDKIKRKVYLKEKERRLIREETARYRKQEKMRGNV